MWKLQPTDTFERKVKKWPKKHHRELAAMVANMQTVFDSLRRGAILESIHFGFMHNEPGGVIGIDQKGGGTGLKESRLYIFIDKPRKTLHVITVGDKNSQSDDISYAKAFADGVKERSEGW